MGSGSLHTNSGIGNPNSADGVALLWRPSRLKLVAQKAISFKDYAHVLGGWVGDVCVCVCGCIGSVGVGCAGASLALIATTVTKPGDTHTQDPGDGHYLVSACESP